MEFPLEGRAPAVPDPLERPATVLLVDDEPEVLAGLRRVIHPARPHWQILLATSGRDAEQVLARRLAEGSVDVLVTDLRMPNGAGWQLLDTARACHPGTARIVLSARIDVADAGDMLSLAHQLVTKPSRAETIITTIDRVLAARQGLPSPAARQLLGGLAGLPRPAQLAGQICAAAEAADPAQALAEVIESDLACCADLIRIAHSPIFTHPAPIDSVLRAVQWVGVGVITSVLLAQCRNAPKLPATTGNPTSLAAEALQVATTARDLALAEGWPHHTTCTLFAAGLLHQCAQPALALGLGGATTAGQASAYLLGLWGLPADLILAITGQDTDGCDPSASATAVLLSRARQVARTTAGA